MRSVTIALNIGRPLNDFLSGQVHEEKGVHEHLKALMELSKTTRESNTFTLTLGLGKKKKATLNIGVLIELLESINLDANCSNEITVNYRNGPDEKIDIAKLKDSTTILKGVFPRFPQTCPLPTILSLHTIHSAADKNVLIAALSSTHLRTLPDLPL